MPAADRRRIQRFLWAFLIGLAPFAVEVGLEELIPSYKAVVSRPTVRPIVAVILFAPLATVPFTTAYAVLFDGIVAVRFALRAALQYTLARYTVIGATLMPRRSGRIRRRAPR